MTGISLQNISKSYDGKTTSLYESSLEIQEGEFVVLVGPSGCGKTTFLRMIAGLEDVTSGKIMIGGRDVTWLEPKKRDVAMVFQNYALYPHMSVEENLQYPLKIMKLSREARRQRIDEVASTLSIDELLHRKPSQLSGGQKQRVAIGRALVRDPKVFLFDEPLSNLDARLREQMRIEIARLHQSLKRTTIYVTHDQHEAMTLGDRIVLMNQGKIVQAGPPRELFENPASLFVAQFLGNPSMNIISGQVHSSGKFHTAAWESPLIKELPSGRDQKLYMGIRPSDLYFADLDETGENLVEGKIKLAEYLGDESHYLVQCGEEELTLVSKNTILNSGDLCKVGFDMQKVFWFDEAGKRL